MFSICKQPTLSSLNDNKITLHIITSLFSPAEMAKAKYPSATSIRAWQTTSPALENATRLARVIYSIGLFSLQVPLIGFDSLFGTTFYGRRSWDFKFRSLRLFASYIIWSLNPGTRPRKDVLSYESRKNPGKLSKDNHASAIDVPPRPDKLFGDALHSNVALEDCPSFWQWCSSMPSPVEDATPIAEQKVMMYFVGGGMVQGHPCASSLPWKIMEMTGVPIFGVNFRKCVTAKIAFPAALQDAVAAYFYLLDEGFLPENICIMGDSGGGGIVVTLLLYLRRHEFMMPGSSILVSPFVDLVDDFKGNKEFLALDVLNPEMCGMVQYQYTENRPDLRSTLLSPARGELPEGYTFNGFPRTLMSYGDVEMFTPSILKLIDHLRKAGVSVEVDVGKDQIHDYPTYSKDRSSDGFYGRIQPFLDGDVRY